MRHELITFGIASQRFGIDIMTVREIRAWSPVTRLPRVPDYVAGVVNLRGAVVPVIDLAARLGWTPTEATPRNMLGFKDGTSNIDRTDKTQMDQLVWLQPGNEPDWAVGGSYQVVRFIRNLVERWDRTQLAAQEAIMGRHKISGAPLGMAKEHDVPDMQALPANAHIRLANPRQPATDANLILRRGYNYARGLDSAGRMDMGLIFVSYQASLNQGLMQVVFKIYRTLS